MPTLNLELQNPFALFLLLFLIPVFLIYFLKSRSQRIIVTTNIFWLEVLNRYSKSYFFERRQYYFLSLFSSLFFVILLAAASVDPVLQTSEKNVNQLKTVIVFDNSAKMNIQNDSGKILFGEAIEKLIPLLNTVSSNHRIAIICTVDNNSNNRTGSSILTGFTNNKNELKQKIKIIHNSNIPITKLNDSIELAEKLIEHDNLLHENSANNRNDKSDISSHISSQSRILVLTAGEMLNQYRRNKNHSEEQTANSKLPANFSKPKIEFCLFGKTVDKMYKNIAITNFQSRLSFNDLSRYELFAELRNFGNVVIKTQLKIFVENQLSDVIPIELNPQETKSYFVNREITPPRIIDTKNTQIRKSPNAGLIIRGEIDINDSFESDNAAYSILSVPKLQKILYYGEDNFFLMNVLKSYLLQFQRNINIERITAIPEIVPFDSVLVINRKVPPQLPTGNMIIFDPKNNCNLFEIGDLISSQQVIGFNSSDSSLVKFTQFDGIELSGVHKLNLNKSKDNKTPVILLSTAENYPVYLLWNFCNENETDKFINIVDSTAIQTTLPELDSNLDSTLDSKLDSKLISESFFTDNNNKTDLRSISRVLVFAADILQSEFVLRASFPILINNALNYFSKADTEPEQNYKTGDSAVLNMEITSDWVELKSPDGKIKILPVYSDTKSTIRTITTGEFREIGIYEIYEIYEKNFEIKDTKSQSAATDKSDKSKYLIKYLACNFDSNKINVTNNSQDNSQINDMKLKESVIEIPDKNKKTIFDFNDLSFWFLFTSAALVLIIFDWLILSRSHVKVSKTI
ncbi:MAG: hypothetical protein LBE18_03140 [Planctomycetaceae bacterium]|jgi:hypothetical protein|nr:hypothetical protein [Planctomycetaceae bacterium]